MSDYYETNTMAIAKETGEKLASKSELVELRRTQDAHDECDRIKNTHTPTDAYKAFQTHQKVLQDAIGRGDLDKLDGWSREEWEAEFSQKYEAARSRRRMLAKQSAPLLSTIAERFVAAAETYASEQAAAEVAAYEKFGVPYPGPSALILALRKAGDIARARVPRSDYAETSPKQACPYIKF